MDTPRVNHVPASRQMHLRWHQHAQITGESARARRVPKPAPRPHYSQDPASYARHCSPGPSAVRHRPLHRIGLPTSTSKTT